MLSCDLIALSDVLLLSCVDKSLRTCVMLAGTSKAIRAKLSYEAKARGLRLMCYSAYDAMRIEQHMRGHFHIGALLLTVRAWPFTPPLIVELKQRCPLLKVVLLHPDHRSRSARRCASIAMVQSRRSVRLRHRPPLPGMSFLFRIIGITDRNVT